MNFEISKNSGGIGALLLFIGAFSSNLFYGSLLSLVGLILVLISLKGLADYYKEARVFNNFLYGVIIGIVGIIVAVVISSVIFQSLIGILFPGLSLANWMTFTTLTITIPTINQILPLIYGFVAVLVVLFVFAVITAFLMNTSLKALSMKTDIRLFATAGTLLLIGAILTIILVGIILIWIAMIILAIAFLSIKPLPPPAAPTATT